MTYAGNPNSANQRWSSWEFRIFEGGRHVNMASVQYNAGRWLRQAFGTAGRVHVRSVFRGWKVQCLVEGPTAHDPQYVEAVRRQFQRDFVAKGWGPMAWSTVKTRIMAGSLQDGKPPAQMIEVPFIDLRG